LLEIKRFFRALIVYFFSRMVEVQAFAKIIDDILNVNASLWGATNYKRNFRQGLSLSQLSDSDVKKKDMIEKLNAHNDMYEKLRVANEQEWRSLIKAGDYIDAINHFATPQNIHEVKNIRGWCPAKVTGVADGNVRVAFLGMLAKH
jgi:hypothetical protein